MITFAKQNIQKEIPIADDLTTAMILRAQNRTVTAVMKICSVHQTREVLSAAYRRAGLVPSFDVVKEEAGTKGPNEKRMNEESAKHIMEAMTTQTSMLAQVVDLMAGQAKVDHIEFLKEKMERQKIVNQ